MITGKNTSKILAKDISWEFICKYDEKKNVIQINGGIIKKHHIGEKDYIWNLS